MLKLLASAPPIAAINPELTPICNPTDISISQEEALRLYTHRNMRLGSYFEQLFKHLIDPSKVAIVTQNEQLISNGITRGELDFLLQDRKDFSVVHLEIAIKFYLDVNGRWIGPNRNDSLTKKYFHMVNTQLSLLDQVANQQWKKIRGISNHKHSGIIAGILFHKFPNLSPTPEFANPYAPKGWWLTYDEAATLENRIWQRLEKHEWVCPIWNNTGLPLSEYAKDNLAQFICCTAENKLERWFLVTRTWITEAQSESESFHAEA